ncbi:hypothetical protein ACVINW_003984 [Bradyrhizobium sp. USDA 4461]
MVPLSAREMMLSVGFAPRTIQGARREPDNPPRRRRIRGERGGQRCRTTSRPQAEERVRIGDVGDHPLEVDAILPAKQTLEVALFVSAFLDPPLHARHEGVEREGLERAPLRRFPDFQDGHPAHQLGIEPLLAQLLQVVEVADLRPLEGGPDLLSRGLFELQAGDSNRFEAKFGEIRLLQVRHRDRSQDRICAIAHLDLDDVARRSRSRPNFIPR